MRRKRWIATFDMYRKVPVDLLEGTKRGSILSIVAILTMFTLFTLETIELFRVRNVTELNLDKNKDPRIPVYFNITMMDVPCDYSVIDTVSVLGTMQNVTRNVVKRSIDAAGVRKRYDVRNRNQKDLILKDDSVEETLEEMLQRKKGEDAVILDREGLEAARRENQFLFVDYFAMWCSHCRILMPTWEKLAEVMLRAATAAAEERLKVSLPFVNSSDFKQAVKAELPVLIAKVDCVANHDLCTEHGVYAFPTLRLYIDGEPLDADYAGDRTLVAFTNYLATIEQQYSNQNKLSKPDQMARDRLFNKTQHDHMLQNTKTKQMKREWIQLNHKGCELSGMLMLDRAPGNFHIEARSKAHSIVPSMANLSHEVHHLSFGNPSLLQYLNKGHSSLPHQNQQSFSRKFNPMDDNVYITPDLHTAYHHHLKVITTQFTVSSRQWPAKAYQILLQSHLSHYPQNVVPEAKFSYDLSPIAVTYKTTSRRWYTYLTSLMAIVGGTFTVVGMLDRGMNVFRKRKTYTMGGKEYRTEKFPVS